MKIIDIDSWKRKEHFNFFSKMTNPFFGITTEIDCTIAYEFAKNNNRSFFVHYLHKSMQAVNAVEELRLRIVNNQVVLFDKINAGATIAREDETFAFIFANYSDDFQTFDKEIQSEIFEVQNSSGLRLNNDDVKKDLIRHSTIPWTSFSAILHPTNQDASESVPKIIFGKFYLKDNKKMFPISIEAHHGLVDGFHLAKYLDLFQKLLNEEN